MKKVLLVLLVGLGVMTSCHNDEHTHEIVFPTASIRLSVDANSNASKGTSNESKSNIDVNRDDIPATVETIDVTVSSSITPIEINNIYTLVEDGSGDNGFVVYDVALGLNNVIATTTTVADGSFNVSQFDTNNMTAQEKLDDNKANIPYAIYDGQVLDVGITGNNDFVNVPMTTQNGRLNTVIVMEESIRDDYYYEVITSDTSITPTNSSKGVSLYWSDENSVDGEMQAITIKVFASDDTFVYESNSEISVIASTGINTLLTINATKVQADTVGFNFSFQPWTEIDGNNTSSCGTLTTKNISGSYSLGQDVVLDGVNLVISGDLNLNGHTLSVPCGSITVSGNLNGGGEVIYCDNLTVSGNTQNNPTITQDCN
tara:strand:- start:6632 stop:7750 length:1119 start_codon:yes stop_codon:yes gene_type:complete